jgi:flagellar motility protein MotE (MotC chaperone)
LAKQGYDQYFKSRNKVAKKQALPKSSKNEIIKNGLKLKARKKKKLKPMPITPIISCLFLLAISSYAFLNEDKIIKFFEKVELQIFTKTFAQEAKPEAKPKKKEKGSLDKFKEEKQKEKAAKKQWTQEEILLFSSLEERKRQLDQREKSLKQLEQELIKQRDQLQAKVKKLESLRSGISEKLEQQVAQDEEKVNKLVAVYSSMKPAQAAKVIEKIDETLAIKVIARMKKKSAAEILNLLEPEKAKRISEKYVGYISMN